MTCFPNTSRIYGEWENKPFGGIPRKLHLLIAGSSACTKAPFGDNITTMIQFPTPKYYNTSTIYVNLTVAGFANLTDTGYSLLSKITAEQSTIACSLSNFAPASKSTVAPYSGYRSDLMIVSWENTLQKLWNYHFRQQHRQRHLFSKC